MDIKLKEITIRELAEGYQDNQQEGVVGYRGRLDIRPPYQREFVYKTKQRDAVINTVNQDFPLNVMYWAVRDDGNFEVIDGQQRTISICQYVHGEFPFKNLFFDNLTIDLQEKILNYKLMIYFCSGEPSEKLDWFEIVNIAGEKLTDQELRNAVYHGPWLSDAKQYFSKTSCQAANIGISYLKGSPIRQEYLETTIKWINDGKVEHYMAENQHKPNANELWLYFQAIISWIKVTFPTYRKEMKGIDWGNLYNEHKDGSFDSKKLEKEISKLMQDDDVTKKSGVYSYVLTGQEKYLNIRAFTDSQKREVYEKQKGKCNNSRCPEKEKEFAITEMEADHVTPWHEGGKTISENCQLLCKDCNRRKSGK